MALSKKSPYVQTGHRVSGLMLANNTGIRHLFAKIMRDYDKLMGSRGERRAFLDPYAQFPRFSDGDGSLIIDEFVDAKDVVSSLAAEYEACERADYVSLGWFGLVLCLGRETLTGCGWCCWFPRAAAVGVVLDLGDLG